MRASENVTRSHLSLRILGAKVSAVIAVVEHLWVLHGIPRFPARAQSPRRTTVGTCSQVVSIIMLSYCILQYDCMACFFGLQARLMVRLEARRLTRRGLGAPIPRTTTNSRPSTPWRAIPGRSLRGLSLIIDAMQQPLVVQSRFSTSRVGP